MRSPFNVGPLSGRMGSAASFKLVQNLNQLPLGITLNSISSSAAAVYRGQDANLSTWKAYVGTDLPVFGSGTDPTLGVSSGFRKTPIGVTFDPNVNGKGYSAPNNTYLDDDGVSDYVSELVFNTGTSTTTEDAVVSKYAAGAGSLFYRNPANAFAGFGYLSQSVVGLADNTWYHVMFFARRGGNVRTYYNSGVNYNGIIVGLLATTASPFQFNGYDTAHNSPGPCTVAWFARWNATNLVNGSTAEMDALAITRYSILTS